MKKALRAATLWWTRDDRSHQAHIRVGAGTDHGTVRVAVEIEVKAGCAGCPSCGKGMPIEGRKAEEEELVKDARSYVGTIELREEDLLEALEEIRKARA